MITIKCLNKRYGALRALDNVNLTIPKGSMFGLLGPNGAGKTSLLRILTKIIIPDTGEILINGDSINNSNVKKIGYLPEERGLYKRMMVGEQALYLASLKGLSNEYAKNELKEWFSKLNIDDWWNKRTDTLSKGMQQKIQFIIAVLHKPEILILDEPFSGLDPINAEIIGNEIIELNKGGTTIILSTHNMNSVEQFCNDIVLLNKGQIILSGQINDIKQAYKTSIYEFKFKKDSLLMEEKIKNIGGKIVSMTHKNDIYSFNAQFKSEDDAMNILVNNISICQIISYNEMLPSMNEIFIETINNIKNQQS